MSIGYILPFCSTGLRTALYSTVKSVRTAAVGMTGQRISAIQAVSSLRKSHGSEFEHCLRGKRARSCVDSARLPSKRHGARHDVHDQATSLDNGVSRGDYDVGMEPQANNTRIRLEEEAHGGLRHVCMLNDKQHYMKLNKLYPLSIFAVL
jgi:hypothetical protein